MIIILLLMLGVITYDNYTTDNTYNIEEKSDCICAFDIDNTITCNEENAKKAINVCKKNKCIIALNTARPVAYAGDLNLRELGLSPIDFENDFYHGLYSNLFSAENIAKTKITHMNTLVNKYNVKFNRAILFDDNGLNIKKAQQAGFSTVFANDTCGLQSDAHIETEKILAKNINV